MGSEKSMVKQLSDTSLMAEGIRKRGDVVSTVGLDSKYADALLSLVERLTSLNAEQEELKAQLKTKTSEINDALKDLKAKYSKARKLVKIAVDSNDWLTFGIGDKK